MVAPNISLKAEYLYADFGSAKNNFVGTVIPSGVPHTTDNFRADLELHTFRVGLNYKFGG